MEELLNQLRGKKIHIVGVTGAEGSSVLRFLVKHEIGNIVAHDFSTQEKTVEKSFRLWHKGLSALENEKLFKQFEADLNLTRQNLGGKYLKDIKNADLVFVPQSWRLYKKENSPLFTVSGKIPFYSLTRLYLDFAPARIIAVTGTVGKGSTANIIYRLLKKCLPAGRKAYFAGNETWMLQLADKLDEMGKDDTLILEISHRQLQEGFSRAPEVVVITNLYPNHLDEVSMEDYMDLKLSLVRKQDSSGIAVLNYDIPQLRLDGQLKSKVIYFSEKQVNMNTKSIQNIYPQLLHKKSDHYVMNLLAGCTVAEIMGVTENKILAVLPEIPSLPARLEMLTAINGVNIYDDIKSTTPWATLAALEKLKGRTILICGGKTKGIDYTEFAEKVKEKAKFAVILKSEMGDQLVRLLPEETYTVVSEFAQSLQAAFKIAAKGDNILVSPGAGFFYSEFIKGKKSLKRLLTSLPPKEPV